MKTSTLLNRTLLITALCVGTAVSVTAQSAPATPAPSAAAKGPNAGMMNGEQRSKLAKTLSASTIEIRRLNAELAAAEQEAVTAVLAAKPDDQLITTLIDKIGKIEAELAVLRYKAMKEVVPTLSAEQQAEMKAKPSDAYYMIFGVMSRNGL